MIVTKDKLKLVGYSVLCLAVVWSLILILNLVIADMVWEIENNGGLKAVVTTLWCGTECKP